jgi:hypothetical protein
VIAAATARAMLTPVLENHGIGPVRVQPEGADEFDAEFENGALRIWLGLNGDGRIEGAGLRPK